MSISFDSLPVSLLIPGTRIEFAPGSRGPLDIDQTLLLIGQMTAAGSATADEPVLVTHPDQAGNMFGAGSVLARMYRTAYLNNNYTETWCLPLEDAGAAVAATGSILLGGAVTKAGTLSLYIGGVRVRIAAAAGDALADLATTLAAAINADTGLPLTAAVNGGTPEQIDLTAKNKGLLGNAIDLRHSYYGQESLPTGLTCTITAMADGTANPDMSDGLAACAGMRFDYFCSPYTDTVNLTALTDELESRWSWQTQTHGHGFTASRGTVGELQALGNTLNSQHLSLMGAGKSPSTPECFAAGAAAVCAYYLNQDPARPLQTLQIKDLMPPKEVDQFTTSERDLLLHDGVATYYLSSDRKVLIEAMITTYQENIYGAPDTSYLYANTPCTLAYVAQSLIAYLTSKFPRHKLADDDGPTPPAGARIATPSLVKAEVISHLATLYTERGVVEATSKYEDQIVSERDAADSGRVNILLPVQLIGQLRRIFTRVEHS